MTRRTIIITNRAGIHARPAAMLVQSAYRFAADIWFEKDSERINGKSIMGIITLGATYQSEVSIMAEGADEQQAVKALAELFDKKFEEE